MPNPYKPYLRRMFGKSWAYAFCPTWDERARARVAETARRDFVAWCHDAGVPAEVLVDAELVCGEAASNVARHSHAMSMWLSVEVAPTVEQGCLVMTIEDTGRGFVPASLTEPDLDDEHGRGIPLMRMLSNQFTIESRPGRTVIRSVKTWRLDP